MDKDQGSLLNLDLKFSLKTLIVLILFGVGLYFLIPKLVGVPQTIKYIANAKIYYLALALAFEFVSYLGAAWLLGIILWRLGYKVNFWKRFKISSITAFAIHFFPVGSFGEGATDYYFLRRQKVETGSILLMFILRIIITYTAFLMIFLVGLILVPTSPYLKLSPKLISFVLFLLVSGGIIYIFYLYKHKDRFRQQWHKFFKIIRYFINKVRNEGISQIREEEIFEDIYSGIGLFGKKKRFLVLSVVASLIYWLGDMTCFYFVFQAFNYHIHAGVLIFAYCASTLLGMISFIPGGLGVVEGSLGLIFAGLGVPGAIAVMSVLVFRFFSFWIWIPVGLYSYLTLSKESK